MELFSYKWPLAPQDSHPSTLMLLHGLGGSGQLWRPLAAGLENFMRVIAPDQRGHGKSRPAQTDTPQGAPRFGPLEYGQDAVELLEREALHGVWVLGHSMGVRSACAAAHLRPDLVSGLILIDLGFSGPAGGGMGDELAEFVRVLPDRFDSRAEARAFMDANCPDPSIGQYLLAVSQATSEGGIVFPFDHQALIETIHAARDTSVRAWVRAFASQAKPVYVLRGAQSKVWSHEEFVREREAFKDLPSVQFIEVEKTGHGLPFEARAWLITQIKAWMKISDQA